MRGKLITLTEVAVRQNLAKQPNFAILMLVANEAKEPGVRY